jgi:hypothetical protein
MTDFSNYGEIVDAFAPGQDIESAWIGGPSETVSLRHPPICLSRMTNTVTEHHLWHLDGFSPRCWPRCLPPGS